MAKIQFFSFFIFLTISIHGNAQSINLGIPPIRNFAKKVYKAGTQNWDMTQDKRGVMYFANNEGLLEFDGIRWKCLPVANNTIVRSVNLDSTGKIFVGAQSEIGYFIPVKNGLLQYHSLMPLIPKEMQNFEDVWDICIKNGDVFFRTNHNVFQFTKGKIIVHSFQLAINAMFLIGKDLFLQQAISEILIFKDKKFKHKENYPDLKSFVTGILPWKDDTILIATLKSGIFYIKDDFFGFWKTSNDELLKNKRIYSCTISSNYQIVIGSSLDGLMVLDQNRIISNHLTKFNGLQNNNILSTFKDKSGNIWLGLDNGIDYVLLDSPFTTILPERELLSTGYCASIFQNNLYLGVSDGLYVAPWQAFYDPDKKSYFNKEKSTDGQVWGLKDIGGKLLMGHHEGVFELKNGIANKISTELGAWTFVQINEDSLLGGTYAGLTLFTKEKGDWKFQKKIIGLNESCRIMVKDSDGSVWISHPYRGIYRINFSKDTKKDIDVKFFNVKNGLPSNLNNYVYLIAGQAVFGTEKGVYRFDKKLGKFLPDNDFNTLIGSKNRIKCLKEDTKGNIWYANDLEVGLLLVKDLGLRKETKKRVFAELDHKLVGGFEFIYPYDENNIFFGTEQGFIHYNGSKSNLNDSTLQVILTEVNASGEMDSLIFGGSFLEENSVGTFQNKENMPILFSNLNNLNFNFSATDFRDPTLLEYHTKLTGSDSKWSEWSLEANKNYSNLSPGSYTFHVQARSKDGRISKIVTYSFSIKPPWYQSTMALVVYLLLTFAAASGFLIKQNSKFEYEKERLQMSHAEKEAMHLKQVELAKADLIETQNEKMAADISFKNKELASSTLHLVQKGEILHTIKEALNPILEKTANPEVKKDIQQLINLLNFDVNLDDDWEQFAFHFDQVHVDFLKRLREKFPQLTANDEKLCAYLQLNLSTKETAQLLNISVRGVEASRYRLRKKLMLSNEANLAEFMMKV